MKRSNNNDIDRLFQSHFDMLDTAVADRDALWYRIQPKQHRKIIPILLLTGLLTAMGFSYSLFVKDIKNDKINPPISKANQSASLSFSQKSTKDLSVKLDRLVESQKDIQPTQEKAIGTSQDFRSLNSVSIINNKLASSTIRNVAKNDIYKNVLSGNPYKSETFKNELSTTKIISPTHMISKELGESFALKKDNASSLRKEHMHLELLSISNTINSIPNPFKDIAIQGLFKKDNNPLDDCKPGYGGHPYMDIFSILGVPLDETILQNAFVDRVGYLSDWDERYATLPSISFGIMVGYEFSTGIDIALGAEYQRMQSQYKTTQTITESVSVYDPMAYFFYDDNNEVVWVGDSVNAVSTYDRTVSVANIHNLLHIPLQVSYPLIRKGPWNIKASAAAVLNLSFQYRGQYLREDNSLIQVDVTNQANYFSPNIGLSFELGGHIGYNLSRNWEAYISPRFRYNQQSYLADSQILNLSRNYVNLRMGVQYHF